MSILSAGLPQSTETDVGVGVGGELGERGSVGLGVTRREGTGNEATGRGAAVFVALNVSRCWFDYKSKTYATSFCPDERTPDSSCCAN